MMYSITVREPRRKGVMFSYPGEPLYFIRKAALYFLRTSRGSNVRIHAGTKLVWERGAQHPSGGDAHYVRQFNRN